MRDQPWGDVETLTGALNRVANVGLQYSSDIVVAIEGGVGPVNEMTLPLAQSEATLPLSTDISASCVSQPTLVPSTGLECFAWAAIRHPAGGLSKARSASFLLPAKLAELVGQGLELGTADDQVFGRRNSGQGSGTIGRLTLVDGESLVTRKTYYEHCVLMALVPFINPELYPGFSLIGLDEQTIN